MFDVFEAFINTDNIQVFANAATDYIMCLMKFVKGLGSSHFSVSVLNVTFTILQFIVNKCQGVSASFVPT